MKRRLHIPRVLALDPVSRGIGLVLFEHPSLLIEWGVRELRKDKHERCLALVSNLLDRFQPDVLVLEDTDHPTCRRCERIRLQIVSIRDLAVIRKVKVCTVHKEQVQTTLKVPTKHEAAKRIAERIPELAPYLPPFRKPWMSEDPRSSIFDAAAFALTVYHSL